MELTESTGKVVWFKDKYEVTNQVHGSKNTSGVSRRTVLLKKKGNRSESYYEHDTKS